MAAVAFLAASPVAADTGPAVVIAAVPRDFPPQYSLDASGRPVGYAIDVMEAVARHAGLQVRYQVHKDWPEAVAAVLKGEADLIPNVGIGGRRMEQLAFTAPVETFAIAVFVRSDTTDIAGAGDLDGRRVGLAQGSLAAEYLGDVPGIAVFSYTDYSDALFALVSGQVDALVQPAPVTWRVAAERRLSGHIKQVGAPVAEVKRAIAVRAGNEALRARLSFAVERLAESDEYKDIYTRWYGQPVGFWSAGRVALAMTGVLALAILSMGAWRYHSLYRTSAALRESEERYRSLVENVSDWVWEVDAEGRYTYSSPRVTDILGYRPDEILGREPFELMPPEEAERLRLIFAGIVEERRPFQNLENLNVGKDGRLVILESCGQPIFDANGRFVGYRGVDRDVTSRKKAEERIHEAAETHRVFADLGRLLLAGTGAEQVSAVVVERGRELTNSPEGFACYVDPATGTLICRSCHGRDCSTAAAAAQQDGVILDNDHPGGRLISAPVALGDKIIGRITFAGAPADYGDRDREVIERLAVMFGLALRRALDEQALIEGQRTLETVAAAARDGIVMMDDAGKVVFWNRAAERIFGYTTEEMLGRPLHDAIAADRAGVAGGIHGFSQTGDGEVVGRTVELEGRRKDGSTVPLEVSVTSVRVGGRWSAVATIRDITARQQMERNRREMELRLFQAQKMESLGTLAGGVAHNFNNLLLPVMALTEMTINELPPDSVHRKRLEVVMQASRRARDLVGRILSFGRQEEPLMERMDLRAVVADGFDLLRSALPSSIELEADLCNEDVPVMADPGQLLTILMNLCRNAADAIVHSTGKITIGVHMAGEGAAAEIARLSLPPGRYACIAVTDTGHGMDAETARRVFDPFFTTKSVGDGTGLGLSTVHSMVVQHKGGVYVESRPGAGSTFRIWLPLACSAAKVAAEPAEA